MIFEVGRVCIKIAGRDADQKCVVVEVLDDKFVMIDGLTRRRKCNTNHLEPLSEIIKIKKGADHKDVAAAFKKMGIELVDKKSKKATIKPMRVRKVKVVVKETKKAPKKTETKAKATEEVKEAKPKTDGDKKVSNVQKSKTSSTATKKPATKKEE